MPRVGLTGSTYFRGPAEDRDIDLFTEDSPNIRAQLLAWGFRPLPISGKCGPNMKAMYRRGRVDVGLLENIDRKIFEQKIASITPVRALMALCKKRTRTKIWGRIQNL